MQAVIFQGPSRLAIENTGDPRTGQPGDAVTRITTTSITTTSICGLDQYPCEGRVPLAAVRAPIRVAGAGRGSAGA